MMGVSHFDAALSVRGGSHQRSSLSGQFLIMERCREPQCRYSRQALPFANNTRKLGFRNGQVTARPSLVDKFQLINGDRKWLTFVRRSFAC
jgi:hypothetical protein